MSSIGLSKIVRVIRRGGGTMGGSGGGAGMAGGIEGKLFGPHMMMLMATNPYMGALMLSMTALTVLEPYVKFLLGATPDPFTFSTMSMADRQHELTLKKIYGNLEGENLFRHFWATNQTEIDVRGKLP